MTDVGQGTIPQDCSIDDRTGNAAAHGAEFVTFTLGSEEFGIDIMQVREIRGWVDTTPIPHAPDFVRGVINLRGMIVPIFDLRLRFKTGVTKATKSHVVIVVNSGSHTVGLLADTVSDIIAVQRKDIQPIPDAVSFSDEKILEGLIILEGGRIVTLVSLAKLIDVHQQKFMPAAA